jgi:hypothetical protein
MNEEHLFRAILGRISNPDKKWGGASYTSQ